MLCQSGSPLAPSRLAVLALVAGLWLALPGGITSAATAPGKTSFAWSNPLRFEYAEGQTTPRREVRDPCIIREGDTYYLVFTMWPFANREEKRMNLPNNGSSPGIALYSSPDLKSWTSEGWLVRSSDLPENCPCEHITYIPGAACDR